MKKVNLKVRLLNKAFWLTVIPAILLLIQIFFKWFGINLAADVVGQEAAKFIEALFLVLSIVGIVNDPTVPGISDSERTLNK